MSSLLVSEIFGPTFQGEGIRMGQRAVFLRLAGCNLACSWCDTPYSWDWTRYDKHTEATRLPLIAIARELQSLNPGLIVISGGEPMIQHQNITDLLASLPPGIQIDIETNGTIAPDPVLADRVSFTVSPKLGSSNNGARIRIRDSVLRCFLGVHSVFKFVICSPDDLIQVDTLAHRIGIPPDRIWLMPQGTSAAEIVTGMRMVAPLAIDRGYHLSSRLQTLIWGNQRGV